MSRGNRNSYFRIYYAKNRQKICAKRRARYNPADPKNKERNARKNERRRFRQKMTSVITEIKKLSAVDTAVEKVRIKRLLHHTEKILAGKLIAHARRQKWRQCKKYLEEFKHASLLKVA